MEKAKFNFAWVAAIIALLAFSYISFMGLVYCQFYGVGLCVLVTLALDALIIFCVRLMCNAKHTRWLRLGLLGQIVFGLIVLVLLLGTSVMFAHFTRIVNQREIIQNTYVAAVEDAQNMGEKYDAYVNERCASYSSALKNLSSSSANYKSLFSNSLSLGFSKDAIITKCVDNLRNLLKGSNENGDIMSKRSQWLENVSASVWNLSLPSNIRDITQSVNKWIDNYKELSSKRYTGEIDVLTFEDSSFNKNVSSLKELCTKIGTPSILSIILALICYGLILLPWIVTPKNIASVGGEFGDVVEMPDEDE